MCFDCPNLRSAQIIFRRSNVTHENTTHFVCILVNFNVAPAPVLHSIRAVIVAGQGGDIGNVTIITLFWHVQEVLERILKFDFIKDFCFYNLLIEYVPTARIAFAVRSWRLLNRFLCRR